MTAATRSSTVPGNNHIVSLDIGTSSVRALLFNSQFEHVEDCGHQTTYDFKTTADGGVEIDPDLLFRLTEECLDTLHAQMEERGHHARAVAISTFWHCFLGVGTDEQPTTSIIHLFDTRSQQQVDKLKQQLDEPDAHRRTGCVFHTSYWPAKLLWLADNQKEAFDKAARWMSFGEYLLLRLGGRAAASTSMLSATGLWDQDAGHYDSEILKVLPVQEAQLSPLGDLDQPLTGLREEYGRRWPLLQNIPWCPAYGDGATSNVGSGCVDQNRFAVMIGTSGAMRVVLSARPQTLPNGIWCYRVNRDLRLMGGALSNGGEVFKWITRTLQLPDDAEQQIEKREPGSHHLTFLPFFAGERSPYWRPDFRALLCGMSLATTSTDILHAALEGVALRFRQIYELLAGAAGKPREIIASGGAIRHSPIWAKMITDSLGRALAESEEPEASSRGAAMLAAQQLGFIGDLSEVRVRLAPPIEADESRTNQYEKLLQQANGLLNAVYATNRTNNTQRST